MLKKQTNDWICAAQTPKLARLSSCTHTHGLWPHDSDLVFRRFPDFCPRCPGSSRVEKNSVAPQDSERAAREFFGGPGPDQGAEPKRMDDGAIVMGRMGPRYGSFQLVMGVPQGRWLVLGKIPSFEMDED